MTLSARALPEGDVKTIVYKDVEYTLEHLRTKPEDRIAVWREDYLVGTAVMYHDDEQIDISYQKTDGDWHETHVVYDAFDDDVIALAHYVIDC